MYKLVRRHLTSYKMTWTHRLQLENNFNTSLPSALYQKHYTYSHLKMSAQRLSLNTLQTMPPEFQLQRKAFEGVTQSLQKMAEMSETDTLKAAQFFETWKGLSQASRSLL